MDRIKKFFGFDKGIHTLLWARLEWIFGMVLAVLAAMSWEPLISLASAGGFTKGQVISLFVVLFVQGVVTEIARRYKADDV